MEDDSSDLADRDTVLLNILAECEPYIESQLELAKHISTGMLLLTRARRDCKSICGVEDLRSEFDSTVSAKVKGSSEIDLETWNGEDAQLFCGLPPLALKQSRDQFQRALSEVVKLAQHARSIDNNVQRILEGV